MIYMVNKNMNRVLKKSDYIQLMPKKIKYIILNFNYLMVNILC